MVRAVTRMPVVGAFVQTSDAATKIPKDHKATGRRPNLSEIGPINSCKIPFMNKKPDKRNWTANLLAPKCASIAGMEGRKMFIDKAPMDARMTNVAIVGGVEGSRNFARGRVVMPKCYA